MPVRMPTAEGVERITVDVHRFVRARRGHLSRATWPAGPLQHARRRQYPPAQQIIGRIRRLCASAAGGCEQHARSRTQPAPASAHPRRAAL